MTLFSGFAVIYARDDDSEKRENRSANAPFADSRMCHSPEVSSEKRCLNKGREVFMILFMGFAVIYAGLSMQVFNFFWHFNNFDERDNIVSYHAYSNTNCGKRNCAVKKTAKGVMTLILVNLSR